MRLRDCSSRFQSDGAASWCTLDMTLERLTGRSTGYGVAQAFPQIPGKTCVLSNTLTLPSTRMPTTAGQRASRLVARRLESAGLQAHIVCLPPEQDPNSYFAAGATAADFLACREQAQSR